MLQCYYYIRQRSFLVLYNRHLSTSSFSSKNADYPGIVFYPNRYYRQCSYSIFKTSSLTYHEAQQSNTQCPTTRTAEATRCYIKPSSSQYRSYVHSIFTALQTIYPSEHNIAKLSNDTGLTQPEIKVRTASVSQLSISTFFDSELVLREFLAHNSSLTHQKSPITESTTETAKESVEIGPDVTTVVPRTMAWNLSRTLRSVLQRMYMFFLLCTADATPRGK